MQKNAARVVDAQEVFRSFSRGAVSPRPRPEHPMECSGRDVVSAHDATVRAHADHFGSHLTGESAGGSGVKYHSAKHNKGVDSTRNKRASYFFIFDSEAPGASLQAFSVFKICHASGTTRGTWPLPRQREPRFCPVYAERLRDALPQHPIPHHTPFRQDHRGLEQVLFPQALVSFPPRCIEAEPRRRFAPCVATCRFAPRRFLRLCQRRKCPDTGTPQTPHQHCLSMVVRRRFERHPRSGTARRIRGRAPVPFAPHHQTNRKHRIGRANKSRQRQPPRAP